MLDITTDTSVVTSREQILRSLSSNPVVRRPILRCTRFRNRGRQMKSDLTSCCAPLQTLRVKNISDSSVDTYALKLLHLFLLTCHRTYLVTTFKQTRDYLSSQDSG